MAMRDALLPECDHEMGTTRRLSQRNPEVFTLPRAAALRSFVMNHLIHHRAQFCVYLRLKNVPLPALYGPSADEA